MKTIDSGFAPMHDCYGRTVHEGDEIVQAFKDDYCNVGDVWEVLAFGIEPSTGKQIAIIRNIRLGYLMSAYQNELKAFLLKEREKS